MRMGAIPRHTPPNDGSAPREEGAGVRRPRSARIAAPPPPLALVRMRLIATGLLLAMAAVFVVTGRYQDAHPALPYLRAFAEAAMVGGLADWFAVTALFRHPLALPIPHTAIIPRNKDRIADTLAAFLRDNFLTPAVVARRMADMDLARAAGRWLTDPKSSRGRVQAGAARLLANILEALDQERLGGTTKRALADQLRKLAVAPLLGRALEAGMAENRHKPLLDGIVRWAAHVLDSNEQLIRDMVHQRANAILRWTGLDETLATAIFKGLSRLISEMAENPEHPMRVRAEEGLRSLARKLQDDPATQARVEAIKMELLDNPEVDRWWTGVWDSARRGLIRVARDPNATGRGMFSDALRQLGETLQTDRALAVTVNRFVRRTVVGVTAEHGDTIVRLVSDTIRGWDAHTITGRLENAVGRDLQYIRINGTVVGGMVGVAIHALDTLF